MKFLIPLIALVAVATAYPGLDVDVISDNTDSKFAEVNPDAEILNTIVGGGGPNGGNGGPGTGNGCPGTGNGCPGTGNGCPKPQPGGAKDGGGVNVLSKNEDSTLLEVSPRIAALNTIVGGGKCDGKC